MEVVPYEMLLEMVKKMDLDQILSLCASSRYFSETCKNKEIVDIINERMRKGAYLKITGQRRGSMDLFFRSCSVVIWKIDPGLFVKNKKKAKGVRIYKSPVDGKVDLEKGSGTTYDITFTTRQFEAISNALKEYFKAHDIVRTIFGTSSYYLKREVEVLREFIRKHSAEGTPPKKATREYNRREKRYIEQLAKEKYIQDRYGLQKHAISIFKFYITKSGLVIYGKNTKEIIALAEHKTTVKKRAKEIIKEELFGDAADKGQVIDKIKRIYEERYEEEYPMIFDPYLRREARKIIEARS